MDITPFVASFRETNQQLIRLLDFLSALRSLSSIDVRQPDERQLIDGVLKGLIENQDFERCSVYLLKGELLENVAGKDWYDLVGHSQAPCAVEQRRGAMFRVGEGFVGQAAATGVIQHCRNASMDERFLHMPGADDSIVGSLISVPIRLGDEIFGVLNVSHPRHDAFEDAHERMLLLFSNFLAQLISNWRHIHMMELAVQERTRSLEHALDEAHELRRRYEKLAVVDELTELHNRRFFFPEARAAIARTLRARQPFGLILIDIDHFKHINDNFGHSAGDATLRRFAGILQGLVREGDILARFGGEEFVIALPNTDVAGTTRLGERLRAVIEAEPWAFGTDGLSLTVSIGISILGFGTTETPQALLDELLRQADIALYEGKDAGRNRVTIYAQPA